MVYITGDTHRDFTRVKYLAKRANPARDDVLIILGDAGINYYGDVDMRDFLLKSHLSRLPITLFCVHGNHEQRPESIGTYEEIDWHGGKVYAEPNFPNLLFAKDGEGYDIAGKRCVVIGGAYSVDKPLRLAHDWGWWPDEQPSEDIRRRVEQRLDAENWDVDCVFSHTCPLKYEPVECFLQGVDEKGVDSSTEEWLDGIEGKLEYRHWYCGHFHINKTIDRLRFLFQDIIELS